MKGLLFTALAAFVVVYVYSQDEITVECPPPNENATLVPHPCNCSSYFVCFAGDKIAMPCPPGLHFNATVHVCDWPWRAGCKINELCPNLTAKHELADGPAYV
nr:PREDICTED: peritrophin-1-like [Megachile rotundata]XP_012139216.1 PREDICTED: peritrophin-1-like [Megachile rotundata]